MMLLQFIILQVVVFGVVIYFLKKTFHGDTNSAIQRLGNVHQDLLQKQSELQKKNEEIEREMQVRKEEAAALTEKMKAEAALEIRKKEDDVLKIARSQAEEIISKAQSSQDDMAKEIESRLSKNLIQFSSEVIRKAISEKVALAMHEELMTDFISKAKNVDLSSVASGTNQAFVIRTPFPLRKDQAEKLNAMLAAKLNYAVNISEVPDSDLIAGMVMQFGSLVLDGSWASLMRDAVEKVQGKY